MSDTPRRVCKGLPRVAKARAGINAERHTCAREGFSMARGGLSPFSSAFSFAGAVVLALGGLTVLVTPSSAAPAAGPAAPALGQSPTGRWIVQLDEPSVAGHSRAAGRQRLDLGQSDNVQYAGHLRQAQRGVA